MDIDLVGMSVMVEASLDADPMEACGLVLMDGTVIEITNVACGMGYFIMDMDEIVAALEKYGDYEGVWHSHPNGKAYPSHDDLVGHPPGKTMYIVCDNMVHQFVPPT